MMHYTLISSLMLVLLAPCSHAFDIPKICNATTRAAALGGMQYECENEKIDASIFEYGTKEEIRSSIDALYCSYGKALFPWLLLNHPRAEVQSVALDLQLQQALEYLEVKTFFKPNLSVRNFLEETTKNPVQYSKAAQDETLAKIRNLEKTPDYEKNMAQAKEVATLLCLPYLSLGCGKALPELIDLLSPRSSSRAATISMPRVTERVLTDPKFVQGASYAALKILDRIDQAELKRFSDGYILSDLFIGYKQAGLSDHEAMDYSWELLAFYSTRGASFDVITYDFFNSENYPLAAALYVISAGMTYLDFKKGVHGNEYSYPPTVRSSCLHGRPYHFWMSAYFTRHLLKQGYSERASILASYLSGMLYEFGAVTWGRDSKQPFLSELYSTPLNSIRANLAVHGVGSVFGSRLNTMYLSLDEDLENMLRSSRALPVMSDEDLDGMMKNIKSRYLSWLWITGADANIRIF